MGLPTKTWDVGDEWGKRWVHRKDDMDMTDEDDNEFDPLHCLSDDAFENTDSPFVVRNMTGTSMCGERSEKWWYPGIGSRMGLPRCSKCCAALGIPDGEGTPENSRIQTPAEAVEMIRKSTICYVASIVLVIATAIIVAFTEYTISGFAALIVGLICLSASAYAMEKEEKI